MKILKKISDFMIVLGLLFGTLGAVSDSGVNSLASISIKPRAVVLGPEVTFGDVGCFKLTDNKLQAQLSRIKISNAPPPGESTEIPLSHIKRCLKVAGFGEYAVNIEGPRRVRVVTAQIEIDKAFTKEEFACILRKSSKKCMGEKLLVSLLKFTYYSGSNSS